MEEDSKDTLLSAVKQENKEEPKKKTKTTTKKKTAAKKKEEAPIYETYEDFPYEDLLVYAGIDCIVSSELLARIFPRLIEQPKYTYYANDKRRFGKAPAIMESIQNYRREAFEFIIDMEINGFKFNVERCGEIKAQMEAELEELDKQIFEYVPEDLNINSGAAIGRYLYDDLGFEVINTTKGGDPSTDGDTLKELAERHDLDWLKTLGKRNDIRSVYTSFVATYVEDYVKPDGRIHPNYNLTGTGSFRISGDNPNLTNLPNPKHGYNVREMFTVEGGEVFLTFDFSSAEVKILGALCRDPSLLDAIHKGMDFHSYTAATIAGIDYKEFHGIAKLEKDHPLHKDYKAKRQAAKAVTFGILYGSSAFGIAAGLGISKEEGEQLIRTYFDLYPGIEQYIKDTHKMCVNNGFVFHPMGQRKQEFGAMQIFRPTPVYNAAKRNAQNVRIQGLASSAGLHAFAGFNRAIKPLGGKSLATVYDSIEASAPIERAAEVIELGFYYLNDKPMEDFDWLDFPIGVDGEIGFNWGEVEEIHRGITQKEVEAILDTMK